MKAYHELAGLYDLAFSWDLSGEVAWLVERLGPSCRSVLEPGCGSGRLLEPLARAGLDVAGLDLSDVMLARARERLVRAGVGDPLLVRASMVDFDLGRRFLGAACPINTLAYLRTRDEASGHLATMARHLEPGARYLVQLDLHDPRRPEPDPIDATSRWEMKAADGRRVRTTVEGLSVDPVSRLERTVIRFEILAGPGQGESFEDEQLMRRWSWSEWRELVADSPFEQRRAWNGNDAGRPEVPVDAGLQQVRLAWHELSLPGARPGAGPRI